MQEPSSISASGPRGPPEIGQDAFQEESRVRVWVDFEEEEKVNDVVLNSIRYIQNLCPCSQTTFFCTQEHKLIYTKNIEIVLLALPSISRQKRNQIINNLNEHKIIVKTLPSVQDIVEGKVSVSGFSKANGNYVFLQHGPGQRESWTISSSEPGPFRSTLSHLTSWHSLQTLWWVYLFTSFVQR